MRRILTALALTVALTLPGALLGPPSAVAQEGSAVTLSGAGEFAGLSVTVAQTRNLIDQSVRVSWTGGAPTQYLGSAVAGNFLQIMQCWGDEDTGPDPTQCEFGVSVPSESVNRLVALRLVGGPGGAPGELPGPGGVPGVAGYVPFRPFGGPAPTALSADNSNPFFDQQITNEVPAALTRPDGRGEVDFEMQSAAQSAGLGCGRPAAGTGVVPPCWLVVVPRGNTLPDGADRGPTGVVSGSPLDQRVWANRIEFRLDFAAQGASCPFGIERPITGHEMVTDAVSRWQPALCADGQDPFSFTRTTDDLVRGQALSLDPDLGIVNEPVPAEQVSADRPLVYAPVAVNALTIAFNLDADPPALAPDDPRADQVGRPVQEMTLNARLVAKLLTQSYLTSVVASGAAIPIGNSLVPAREARSFAGNPQSLQLDPEFVRLNPDLEPLLSGTALNPLVPLIPSDLTGLLWDWVLNDPAARAFVDGEVDAGVPVEQRVRVNDANQGLRSPQDTFPRDDVLCQPLTAGDGQDVEFCPLDKWPYTDDMLAAARSAARGEDRGRGPQANYDATTRVTSFTANGRQPADRQMVMAVVDAATAERFRLPTVKLVNASGQAVAPDAAGLAAAVAAMQPSGVEGVLRPDPATTNPAAYPLTSVSYAVTAPTGYGPAAAEAAADYARFLRYAAGPGQTQGELVGQLPPGYLPLPQAMRDQTLAAADTIERLAAGVGPTPTPTPGTSAGPTAGGGATGGVPPSPAPPAATTGTGSTAGGAGTVGPTPSPAVVGTAVAAGPGAAGAETPAAETPAAETPAVNFPQPVAQAQPTPALPVSPAVGGVLVALLIGGALASAAAPLTHLLNRRLVPEGGDAADRVSTA